MKKRAPEERSFLLPNPPGSVGRKFRAVARAISQHPEIIFGRVMEKWDARIECGEETLYKAAAFLSFLKPYTLPRQVDEDSIHGVWLKTQ